jgi:hypothetical protein
MKSIQVLILAVCSLIGPLTMAEEAAKDRRAALDVELKPAKITAVFGRPTDVEIRMTNASDMPLEVYDPAVNALLWGQRAVVLEILDADGNDLGNLLPRYGVSASTPYKTDWVSLEPGKTASGEIPFLAGKIPDVEGGVEHDLPPGKYFLELRVHGHVLSGRPDLSRKEAGLRRAAARAAANGGFKVPPDLLESEPEKDPKPRISYEEWERTLPGPEILRSKRIELEILPRTGE